MSVTGVKAMPKVNDEIRRPGKKQFPFRMSTCATTIPIDISVRTRIVIMSVILFASLSVFAGNDSKPVNERDIQALALDWTETLGAKHSGNKPDTGLAGDIPKINFEDMDGRIFLWDGPSIWWDTTQRDKKDWIVDYPKLFKHYRSLGITDLVCCDFLSSSGQGTVSNAYPENIVPPMAPHRLFNLSIPEIWKKHAIDPVRLYGEQCRENRLGVWLDIHGLHDSWAQKHVVELHKDFYALESDGSIAADYPYDLLNEKTFEFMKFQIDYAIKAFEPYGVLKGFSADEWYFNYVRNNLGGRAGEFKDFCRKHFGEPPPQALIDRQFSKNGWAYDKADVWWRRYVLWKRSVVGEFEKRIVDYAHSKNLEFIGRTQSAPLSHPSHGHSGGFRAGNNFQLSQLYDYQIMNGTDALWLKNAGSIFWLRGYVPQNRANIVNGRTAVYYSSMAVYWALHPNIFYKEAAREWQLPNCENEMMTMSRDSRRWQGGERLKDIAVLTSSERQVLWSEQCYNRYKFYETGLRENFLSSRPCDIIDVELPGYIKHYPNCVVPPDGLKNVAPESLKAVLDHITNGALVLSLMAEWSTSNPDITNIVDKTAEITGVKYGNSKGKAVNLVFSNQAPILAGLELKLPETPFLPVTNQTEDVITIAWLNDSAGGRLPAISQRKAGKGTLVSVHFDLARLLNDERAQSGFPVFRKVVNALINHFGKPEPLAVDGEAKLAQSVIKNGDLAVTLLPRDPGLLPAFANIVPSQAIIVPSAKYDVNTLATGKAETVNNKDGGNIWSGEELLKGVKVAIGKERGYQLLEIIKHKQTGLFGF
ncbi:MAG: hypothetical protein WCS96_09940 [Victivallales bacterium]